MEEGGFQFQPGISVRFTASPGSPDIDWDGLDQLLLHGDISSPEGAIDHASSSPNIDLDGVDLDQLRLPGDVSCPELAIDNASSSPNFFASPSTIPSHATTTTAATNTLLSQPSTCSSQPGAGVEVEVEHTMASEGAMVDLDSDLPEQLHSGENNWPEFATNDSISSSSFASPSTVPLDATTNWVTPASIQPSIPVPRTTSSEDAAVDADHLLERPRSLSGDNPWTELAIDASSSPILLASPSTFPSHADAETTTTPWDAANTCFQWSGASSSVRKRAMQRCNSAVNLLWVLSFAISQRSDSLIPFSSISIIFEFFKGVERDFMGPEARSFLSSNTHLLSHLSSNTHDYAYYTLEDTQSFTTKYQVPVLLRENEKEHEVPMVNLVNDLAVREEMRLPVFEKRDHSCLGVIELISTADKLISASQLDTICSALQAVNLTITPFSSISRTKFNNASYKDALTEALQVLRAASVIHELPLAQTWATCGQQGKRCIRHSDESCRYCISTIDLAYYVNDPRMLALHYACSELYLLRGQGVAGKAFTTNHSCFLPDIGSSSDQEYPLPHHAKFLKLKGVMAIRLRCTRTGKADFVMEFFLPTDCEAENEQNAVLNSLSGTVQSLCRTLRMVTDKEMEDDAMCRMNGLNSFGLQKNKQANKRKRMARRSHVWISFTEVMVGDTVKAKCNYCGKTYCCDSENGTSSLAAHLRRCKLNPNNRITGPI